VSRCSMFLMISQSIGKTGISSFDFLYMFWHFSPYCSQLFVVKLTASPMLIPVEKPAWYEPGSVKINSPGF
jgi:hypothetical protein